MNKFEPGVRVKIKKKCRRPNQSPYGTVIGVWDDNHSFLVHMDEAYPYRIEMWFANELKKVKE